MVLSDIYKLYSTQGLKSLEVMEDKGKVGTFSVIASASPRQKVADFSPTLGLEAEDIAPLFAKSGYSKTTLTAYAIIGSRNIKTENLGKWKNEKKEQESNDATHHAEQAFFLDELEDFLDSLDSRDKKKKIQVVLEITSSPCADCSLTLKQLVNKKRRQGYDLEMTVRALSVYGGVKKGNVPKWKDSEFALKNFDKPWFKIEAWDVVKELSDAGVPVPEKVSGESFLKPLTDKIRKCKDTIDRMKKLRLGST